MNTILKAITNTYEEDTIPTSKVIGIFESNKLEEAISDIKLKMLNLGYELKEEKKDCCNYWLKFTHNEFYPEMCFYSGDYILNELNF